MIRTLILAAALALALNVSTVQAKDKTDDISAIKQLEQQWLEAYIKADTAALEKIEADDFVLNGPLGAAQTKAEDIQSIKSGSVKFTDMKFDEIKIRTYGKTAIATGLASIKGTADGKDISGKYRFTDVFVRKNKEWTAVLTQLTPVAAKH